MQNTINLFLLQYSTVGVTNGPFNLYTQGWTSNYTGTTSNYPSLTTSGAYQDITSFQNWQWKNGAMMHQPYNGAQQDDYIFQTGITLETGVTYLVSYDVVGNTSDTDYLQITLVDATGSTIYTDGRYTEVMVPTITGSTLKISTSSGFTGQITNINITQSNPVYRKLDLVDSESFTMNFQLMTDITTKGGTYSFNFDLVGDGNNIQQLGTLLDPAYYFNSYEQEDISIYNFYNKTIPAGIAIKDFPFIYGQLILQQGVNTGNNKTITAFFTNELKSFADQVGDKLIVGNDFDNQGQNSYDINFSEYNHYFNWNNIFATHNTTSTNISLEAYTTKTFPNFYKNSKGLYYGFMDLDGPNSINLIETNKALVQNIRPSIYVKELWDKIWARTNYTYVSSFLTGETFKSLVIPMTFDKSNTTTHNINGTADQEYNIGMHTQGLTSVSGGTSPYADWAGYGSKQNGNAGFLGRNLFTIIGNNFGDTWRTVNAPFNLSAGTIAFQDLFVNTGVTYNYNLQLSGCGNVGQPFCEQPYWQVTTAGNYDIGIKIGFNIWAEWYPYTAGPPVQTNETDTIDIMLNVCRGHYGFNGTGYSEIYDVIKSEMMTVTVPWSLPLNSFIFNQDKDLICEANGVDCWVGDRIFAQVAIRGHAVNPHQYMVAYWADVKTSGSVFYNKYNIKNFYEYSTYVDMQKCLPPQYQQMEFIKDVMNMFNLTAQPIPGTNQIQIEPWDQFFNINNPQDFIIWRGLDTSGNTINKIDTSGDITIESIPDLLYQDVYMHFADDSNDTNLYNYSNKYTKIWGSRTIQNPYLTNGTTDIINNFSPTAINKFGNIGWLTSQIYNKDKQPQSLNIPADETFNKRILFRNKLSGSTINGTGIMFVYGNYGPNENWSRTPNVIPPAGALPVDLNFVLENSGTGPDWLNKEVYVVDNDDQTNIFYGVVNNYNSGTKAITVHVTSYQTLNYTGTTYPDSDTDFWEIRTITDNSFGVGSSHPYQPYIGPLYNPYSGGTQDLNFGVNHYYFTSNNTTNNLFNLYWKNKLLTYINPNSKYVTMKAYLTLADIVNLDFRKKIMIDNNLYILNKVSSWSPGKSCKIELIQLSDYPSNFSADQQNWQTFVMGGGSTRETSAGVVELYDKGSVQLQASASTYIYKDIKNYYPLSAKGVIVGKGNRISATNFNITGDFNTVKSDNVTLINSNYTTVNEGLTNVFVIGSTGGTITESNTTIINNINITPKINWITDQSGYTLQLSDAFTTIVFNSDIVSLYLLIPSGTTFPTGTKIEFFQYGAGQIVFINDTGVLLYSLNSAFASSGAAAQCVLQKIGDGDNIWILYGDIALL